MFTQLLTALLRRNDGPPEYAQIDSFQSSGARSLAGVCGITPSGRTIVYLKDDTVLIKTRFHKEDASVKLPDNVLHGMNGTPLTCMSLSEDCAYLGCVDGSIYVVSLPDISIKHVQAFEHDCITAIAVEGSLVLASASTASWVLFRYDIQSQQLNQEAHSNVVDRYPIKAVSLCPQNAHRGLLAFGSEGRYMDLYTDQVIVSLVGHSDSIRACAVQNDLGITGSFDMSARIWDLTTGACLHRLDGHIWFVLDVALSPSGHQAITCGLDRKVKLWDVQNKAKEICELPELSEAVRHLSLSASGRYLITGTEDHVITLYDLWNPDAQRILALCAACHSRLGKNSSARNLPGDVLRRIRSMLFAKS